MNISAIRITDKIIGPIISLVLYPFKVFAKNNKDLNGKNILLIQLWGVGETILTLPAIDAIKKKYPSSKISVLATERNRAVYENVSFIDKVVTLKMGLPNIAGFIFSNYRKYDLVIDFEEYLNISSIIAFMTGKESIGYSHKPSSLLFRRKTGYNDKQHVVETHLDLSRLVGADGKYRDLIPLKARAEDKKVVDELLESSGIKEKDRIWGICVGAAESARSRIWSGERFAEAADIMAKKYGAKVIFVGSNEESKSVEKIQKMMKQTSYNLAGKTDLKQLFYLISRCELFLSNDTGPMHIAAAQGCRTIGLFGPNIPARWGPYGRNNISLYKGTVCKHSPCINVHKGEVPECVQKENICMKEINVKDVIDAIDIILKREDK